MSVMEYRMDIFLTDLKYEVSVSGISHRRITLYIPTHMYSVESYLFCVLHFQIIKNCTENDVNLLTIFKKEARLYNLYIYEYIIQ